MRGEDIVTVDANDAIEARTQAKHYREVGADKIADFWLSVAENIEQALVDEAEERAGRDDD